MPESVIGIISNVEQLVSRIKKHSEGAEALVAETQSIFSRIEGLKQYEEEVVELNSHRLHQPRSSLLVAMHRENEQFKSLRMENSELKASLAEHQSTMDMIMCKYREHISKLNNQNIADRRINDLLLNRVEGQSSACSNSSIYDNLLLQNKICEMASVMKRAIRCDRNTANQSAQTIKSLQTQNENLRHLIGISNTKFPSIEENYLKTSSQSYSDSEDEEQEVDEVSLEERTAVKHSLSVTPEGRVMFHCPVDPVSASGSVPSHIPVPISALIPAPSIRQMRGVTADPSAPHDDIATSESEGSAFACPLDLDGGTVDLDLADPFDEQPDDYQSDASEADTLVDDCDSSSTTNSFRCYDNAEVDYGYADDAVSDSDDDNIDDFLRQLKVLSADNVLTNGVAGQLVTGQLDGGQLDGGIAARRADAKDDGTSHSLVATLSDSSDEDDSDETSTSNTRDANTISNSAVHTCLPDKKATSSPNKDNVSSPDDGNSFSPEESISLPGEDEISPNHEFLPETEGTVSIN